MADMKGKESGAGWHSVISSLTISEGHNTKEATMQWLSGHQARPVHKALVLIYRPRDYPRYILANYSADNYQYIGQNGLIYHAHHGHVVAWTYFEGPKDMSEETLRPPWVTITIVDCPRCGHRFLATRNSVMFECPDCDALLFRRTKEEKDAA